jgi:hypothetical protein
VTGAGWREWRCACKRDWCDGCVNLTHRLGMQSGRRWVSGRRNRCPSPAESDALTIRGSAVGEREGRPRASSASILAVGWRCVCVDAFASMAADGG